MKISELIPSFSRLNELYFCENRVMYRLSEIREVNTFYTYYSNMSEVEHTLVDIVGTNNFEIVLKRLKEEVSKNLSYYSSYEVNLAKTIYGSVYELQLINEKIKEQKNITNKVYREFKEVDQLLDYNSSNDNEDDKQLQIKHDALDVQHKQEQLKLKQLYDDELDIKKEIIAFTQIYEAIKELDVKLLTLIGKYETLNKNNPDSNEDNRVNSNQDSIIGVTVMQNLREEEQFHNLNKKIIQAIDSIFKKYEHDKNIRTKVGYCIIALNNKKYINKDTNDDILINDFNKDYLGLTDENDIKLYEKSVKAIIRSYRKRDNNMYKDKEKWGNGQQKKLREIEITINNYITGQET